MDFKVVPVNIQRYMHLLDISPKHLAATLGMSERSLYRRFKDPGTFTLQELSKATKKFKVTLDKLLEAN